MKIGIGAEGSRFDGGAVGVIVEGIENRSISNFNPMGGAIGRSNFLPKGGDSN